LLVCWAAVFRKFQERNERRLGLRRIPSCQTLNGGYKSPVARVMELSAAYFGCGTSTGYQEHAGLGIPRVKLQCTICLQNFAPAQPATRNRTGRPCIVRLTKFSGFSYTYRIPEMQVLSWGESETNIAA
jgi:hypothetical protein